ncbi:mitochondrial ornithine transporter 1-like [Mizuhopecten yessoensis]|uniref:Mitochondrial ornithine transporter 1 n=1 Tax=Mizuhopecten yessoensis TaxID=6573 RepID=A0A210PLA8_MIZYE|nr:mitochondrial ornithine transporter 1-like [Mizuhopecten yessoensis]XP_021339162.1 mitochondrial ornithine transporter 1-like [Mizuhopecten yessoensis]XP_021339164.1 mitochondrial ornithine transporter 1-like [Mizuhopecten yessoensis]OWF37216.1 Mitochondrial ornithine transporter 1 [Mizuhopecten yessoensis]
MPTDEMGTLDGSVRVVSPLRQTVDASIDFVGGVNGGIANVVVGQSLDTVKVKMQTFPSLYKNALDCFMKTYRQDGIRGLYAGTLPAMTANIAENSVLFMFYGLCQKVVMNICGKQSVADLHPVENAISGSGAAFFCSFTLCPTELIKCRLQAMREMATQGKLEGGMDKLKIGPWGLTKDILRQEGIQGMFKGLTSTMAREVPGYFFFFGGYEISRHYLTPPGKTKDEIGVWRTVVSGGIGGVCLWVTIFPTDVVKSRIQVESTVGTKAPAFFKTLTHIGRTEGIRALYNGLGPTVVRTFPSTGALFLTYETTKRVLTDFADRNI